MAGIRAPIEDARQFGVIEPADDGRRIRAFREKPGDPVGLADDRTKIYASMGNYVFTTKTLIEALSMDAADERSAHDIGGNIIPMLVEAGEAQVYDFLTNRVPGETERDHGYWRDVGTLDSYYEANMDLVSVHPVFNLYNHRWPILTWNDPLPPAKFVSTHEGEPHVVDSMVAEGAIISGAEVRRSILSANVRIHSRATVEDSVLMNGVVVGPHAVIRRGIVDKQVHIPEGARIGVDLELDRDRFAVSDSGVVVE